MTKQLEQATDLITHQFETAQRRMKQFSESLQTVGNKSWDYLHILDNMDARFEDAAMVDLCGRLLGHNLKEPRKTELTIKDMIEYCEDILEREASYRICNSTSTTANLAKMSMITVAAQLLRDLKQLHKAEQKEAA